MPLPSATYPFDPTGLNIANKVVGEQHIVTDNNYKNFFFCVPKFGPFFANSVRITNTINGTPVTLTEGVDYYCAIPFIGATRSIGSPVYGGVSFSNLNISGVVSITYQTLGGEWLFDDAAILTTIANQVYNPRTISWEQVTGVPNIFPVINHNWNLDDMVGESEILASLGNIESAILSRAVSISNLHLTNFRNPHNVTKAQIGLGLVENFAPATLAEAVAGTSTNTVITPSTLMYALTTLGGSTGGTTNNGTPSVFHLPQLFISDGVVKDFPLSAVIDDTSKLIVSVNYVIQDPLDAYTLTGTGNVLTLSAAVPAGSRILVRYLPEGTTIVNTGTTGLTNAEVSALITAALANYYTKAQTDAAIAAAIPSANLALSYFFAQM